MAEFLTILGFSVVFSFLHTLLVDPRIPNPAIVKCVVCSSKLYSRPPGIGAFITFLAWNMTGYLLVWRIAPPIFVGAGLIVLLAFPFFTASNRIYHTYWRWRHPLRCGEGGHFKPAPVPT